METNPELTELMKTYLRDDTPVETPVTREQAVKKNTEQMKDKRWKYTNINGELYGIKVLGARKGTPIGLKLKGIVLPMIARGIDGIKQEDMFEAPQTFTEMAYILTQQLDNIDVESLIFDGLLCDVCHQGIFVDNTDDFFAGNYGVMVELLAFSLKENFASVFTVGGLTSSFQTKIKSLLGLGKDSTPESTTQE